MKLGHFHLHAASVDKTVAFYTEYFELQNLYQDEEGNAFLRDEDGLDFVVSPLQDGMSINAATHIGFKLPSVEDVQAIYDKVKGPETIVNEIQNQDGFAIFSLRDPDNLEVEVYHSPL